MHTFQHAEVANTLALSFVHLLTCRPAWFTLPLVAKFSIGATLCSLSAHSTGISGATSQTFASRILLARFWSFNDPLNCAGCNHVHGPRSVVQLAVHLHSPVRARMRLLSHIRSQYTLWDLRFNLPVKTFTDARWQPATQMALWPDEDSPGQAQPSCDLALISAGCTCDGVKPSLRHQRRDR
jgi:hypothetical protein